MTDDEIIKALEHLMKKGDAPIGEHWELWITTKLAKDIFDLINHQKAENESLKVDLAKCSIRLDNLHKTANEIKSEARKEFAEQFAKELSKFDMSTVGLPDYDRGYKDCMTAVEDTIDNLLEEMEEDKNGKENE